MGRERKASRIHAACWVFCSALLACSKAPTGGASAVVRVVVDAAATSLCVRVVLLPSETTEIRSSAVTVNGTSRQADVAFSRGALPERVRVFAIGFSDAQCTTASTPVERTEEEEIVFTEGKTRTHVITLTRREGARDADGDGYVSQATGGTDCDDDDAATHPGTTEVCGNQKDDNCDQAADCADLACGGATCGIGASCAAQACRETNCTDGEDNDGDGQPDCGDVDCAGKACASNGTCQMSLCQNATTELGLCADKFDNDGDGLFDCNDPDCANQACTGDDKCSTGARCQGDGRCGGGSLKMCPAPANGCLGAGTCMASTGQCSYPPKAGIACDDGNPCTDSDVCSSTGVCMGANRSCNQPPSCFTATGVCDPNTGCVFTPSLGASCDDADGCTLSDQCQADGGCGGTRVTCTPTACQTFQGQCQGDGGCVFSNALAGTPCGAGVCNGNGRCIGGFAYTPSNFTPAMIPTPSGQVTVLDCAQVTIDVPVVGPPVFTQWCAGQPLPGVAEITLADGNTAPLLSFDSLMVGPNTTVQVRGARPLIVASLGDITMTGKVLVIPGAIGCAAGGAGEPGKTDASNGGGGGGAFGSQGGPGGHGFKASGNSTPGEGGPGGTANGVAELVPLRGGCPGGMGAASSGRAATGGGGLQLSAAGDVVITGIVSAPGEGGLGGTAATPGRGGNGGGSGGALLFEGHFVTLSGKAALTVNGGGGGEGGGTLTNGQNGDTGRADTLDAARGGAGAFAGGSGGNGAAKDDAQPGQPPSSITNVGGGGGGGGVGRIRLNVVNGCSVGPTVVLGPEVSSNHPGVAGCP